jgi:hypothetical protein
MVDAGCLITRMATDHRLQQLLTVGVSDKEGVGVGNCHWLITRHCLWNLAAMGIQVPGAADVTMQPPWLALAQPPCIAPA